MRGSPWTGTWTAVSESQSEHLHFSCVCMAGKRKRDVTRRARTSIVAARRVEGHLQPFDGILRGLGIIIIQKIRIAIIQT